MLESIGISLISTMISFLFEQNVLRRSSVDIQGAPSWYEKKSNPERIYVSTYINGDIDSIDETKQKVVKQITLIIENGYKVTIKKHFVGTYSKREKLFIDKMQKDFKLSQFVEQNVVFQNIKYNEKFKKVFIRGYINIDSLKEYQTNRMIKIKKKVLDYQFDDMMEELEKEAS
ncbi:MAG: hypothetical protein U9R39_07200 [Campylobacterota bacterium]|nr:hypothetical protein [Campylobacterota bacterium]